MAYRPPIVSAGIVRARHYGVATTKGTDMRTMTARYRGTCRSCGGVIIPGDVIRHAGRGRSFHAEGACEGDGGSGRDSYRNVNPATGERMSDRARVHVARFSSGAVMTVNSRGRCIDAPCCGCCT